MVLDSLDGRVARLTKTQSAFGAEFDSLADMVSFGAAPALVMYEWVLRDLGKLGWVAAFIYCAGAALRLARFNTMLDVADKRWFTGIPSPAAAALVAGFVWVMDDYDIDPTTVRYWALFVTVFAGLTMVSNLKYYSFKAINLRKSVPFMAVLGAALLVALAALQPPLVLFGGFVAYAISGYVVSAWLRMRRHRPGATH
jgi:CDP-diacylglycerol--serine O-phosphatidyltransferase